ncbi:MAG: class I SAM-dependent methyltransferase, partial [Anaerolineae bacterium]|nr:class I SAM-dependent methyltransferase [Anaerolineae bacterium]
MRLEDGSFWFRNRNRLLIWALRKYFPEADNLLEVGCGTGYVLRGITGANPALRLAGSEIYDTGLGYARQRIPHATFYQMDARAIPFRDEFAVVGAFDVLEHIEEDQAVLRQMYQAVRPGGGIMLSVPQHPALWSEVDVYSRHVRRYT